MISKYLMDDKQLNFNQPLLSVRRGSSSAPPEGKTTNPPPSIPPLPYYKSELKSGPVRNPGAIPFQWEQIPGKPKGESKLHIKAVEQPPTAPKLPPGRVTNNDENPSDKPSKEPSSSKSQLEYDGISVSDSSSMYKNAGEFERSEDAMEENGSVISEGENSTYLDALDTLSRSESFFLNCSVTGVSGLDGPSMKPSGTLSDPLARDFMMGRFLPAAKAVASETPHFGSKKQPVAKEPLREVKKVMISDKRPPRYYYTPISLPQHPQFEEDEEDSEEEDDNDNDFGGTENVSVKLCGLLPRFCLLSPIPGMKDQVPRPISSVRKINKKPGNFSTFSKTDKAIRDAVYEKRRLAVYQKSDMRIDGGDLKYELDKLNPQNGSMRLVELSKCPGSERTNIAPYKNVSCHSLMQKEKQFLGIPEAAKDSKASKPTSQRKTYTRFPEALADETAEQEPSLADPTIVKTLYVDSAQLTESRRSNSSSSESRSLTDSRGRTPSIDYSLHDIKDLRYADDMVASQSRNMDTGEINILSSQETLNQKTGGFHQVQDHKQDDNEETTMDRNPILPLPLPKSPSESWLSRTLPSVSSRNPKSCVNNGNPGFRASPVDPKWEAVVKSSKLHNKHFGLPALTPISEN